MPLTAFEESRERRLWKAFKHLLCKGLIITYLCHGVGPVCSEYDSCNPVIMMPCSTGDWLLHKQTHISPAAGISGCRTWRIVGPDCRSCSWCGGRWGGGSCRGRGEPAVGFSEAWSYTAAQKETKNIIILFIWVYSALNCRIALHK